MVCLHSGLPLSCWEKLKFQLNGQAKNNHPEADNLDSETQILHIGF